MSVFDPESSSNRFSAEFKLTGDAGSPYAVSYTHLTLPTNSRV